MTEQELLALYKDIGQRIKEARKRKGWTMSQLAAEVNLSQSAISMIENGVRKTPVQTLARFSKVLDEDFTQHLTLSGETNKDVPVSKMISVKSHSLDFELVLTVQDFHSEFSDQDINTAVYKTFVTQLQQLLESEEIIEKIDEELKSTIKETLDRKQSEFNKLYNKISD